MDQQLRHPSLADSSAGVGHCGIGLRFAPGEATRRARGVRSEWDRGCRHHRHSRRFTVPVLDASSTHPEASLTVWDASSSRLTLFIMLLAVVVFLPVVLVYTGFVLRVMRGRVRLAEVERREALY